MRILVTGATGFIGSHVVRELVARGHETYGTVRPGASRGRLDDVRDRVSLSDVDLADGSQVSRLLGEVNPSAIVHLAWYAEPGRYLHAVAENVAAVRASAELFMAAAKLGCPRVVLAGTCLEDVWAPTPPMYAACKSAVHRLSEGFLDSGMTVACGHVFYLFGPGEDNRRVIPSVIRALLRSEPIATTEGVQRRDYLHVADVASAFATLAESSVTRRVDICSGVVVALRDVLEIIGDEIGGRDLIRFGGLVPSGEQGFPETGNPERLRSLGWRPQRDLRAAVIDTIGWWRREESPS